MQHLKKTQWELSYQFPTGLFHCHSRKNHIMHAHGSADDTASAHQYAWPLPRSSAAIAPCRASRTAAQLLSRDTLESSSLRETMGMSGVVKSKLSDFFFLGSVNTLFFVNFPGMETMFEGSSLFATPKTCF